MASAALLRGQDPSRHPGTPVRARPCREGEVGAEGGAVHPQARAPLPARIPEQLAMELEYVDTDEFLMAL